MDFSFIIASFVFIVVIAMFYAQYNARKKLGALILEAVSGSKSMNHVMSSCLIVGVGFFLYPLWSGAYNPFEELSAVVMMLAAAVMAVDIAVHAVIKKGCCENGVQSSSSALDYSQIYVYDTYDMGSGFAKVVFNGGKQMSFIVVYNEDLPAIKALLKKKCKFKKF
ncbi:MAG: hypothetical protein FWG10_12930 [Eubacteriaceae bacterium]|nr:hypothetical protein [Eubacteriaceae bacterium]